MYTAIISCSTEQLHKRDLPLNDTLAPLYKLWHTCIATSIATGVEEAGLLLLMITVRQTYKTNYYIVGISFYISLAIKLVVRHVQLLNRDFQKSDLLMHDD